MTRHINWQTKLSDFIRKVDKKEFDFPTWNCAIFAADAVKAITNKDPLKDIRGKFNNEIGASKKIKSIYDVKTVQELFKKQLNTTLKPIAFARIGDIVFMSNNASDLDLPIDTKLFGPIPGLCYGQQSYFVGENGLIKVETLSLRSTLWVS